jgi:HK97 family phage major capsid protein
VTRLEADLASVLMEAKPLAEKSGAGELSADESARFDELTKRVNTIGEELTAAKNQAAAAASVLEYDKHFNQPADQVKRGLSLDTAIEPGKGGTVVTGRKSLGQKFVESAEFKQRNSRGVMYDAVKFNEPEDIKTLITSGSASAYYVLTQVYPTIYRPLEAPLVMRDVLLNMTTNSDNVTVLQEGTFTNSAAEVIEATTTSDGAKAESALTFTEATFPVQWIAHWIPITRQMLEDLAMMQSYVDDRLLIGLRRREDNQFLNGNGTAPNLRGILATSGIQTLDGTYFTGSAVQDAGTDNENVNRIRRAKRVIQVTGKATATFVVMNPTDLENIDTITDSTRQYLLAGPLAAEPRRLWGLQVVESENIAAGTALVGDGTMAAVVDRMDARIYTTDSHSDFFIRNIFVILAEERVALPVFRPAAFAKVTLAAWS